MIEIHELGIYTNQIQPIFKGRQRVLNIAHVKMMAWMGLEHRGIPVATWFLYIPIIFNTML